MPDTTPNNTEQRARLALLGIRYDENSSFTKGAADAPPQIRAALRSDAWNLTSENGTDLSGDNVFFDAGDIEPVPGSDMFTLIENSVYTLIADGLSPISLGGDHSVTYPIVRAFARKFRDLSVVHFDAHADTVSDTARTLGLERSHLYQKMRALGIKRGGEEKV